MRAVTVLVLTALALAGCGGGDEDRTENECGESGSCAAPPRPELKVDPRAGAPVLLVEADAALLALDARARIRRVLRRFEAPTMCPGGRTLVDVPDTSGSVEVVSLATGKRHWRTRIPRGSVFQVACLDPDGDRVAVVVGARADPNDPLFVHHVDRRRDRRLKTPIRWAAAVTPSRVYDSADDGRLIVRAFPSLLPLRTYTDVPAANWVHVSGDARYAAITTIAGLTRLTLLDLSTGAIRKIDASGDVKVVGWLGDHLVLHDSGEVRLLDPDLVVRERVAVQADTVEVVDGALIATHRDRVFTLRGPSAFKGGTLPESVSVIGALD